MGQKDKTSKLLLDYNDVFADIVNVLVAGEPLVREQDLMPSGTESVYKAETGGYASQLRDISKVWAKGGVRFAIIGMEGQAAPDSQMPLRVIGYDGASYRSQYGKGKPVPVVTLVLNFGSRRWEGRHKSLYGIMDVPGYLQPFVPDYHINVIDVAFLGEGIRKQFKSDFKIIADFFYGSRVYGDGYHPPGDRIKHVYGLLDFLAAYTGDARYRQTYDRLEVGKKEGDGVSMCEVLQGYWDRGVAEGRAEGRAEAIVCLLKKDMPDDFILSLGYTVEEIRAAKEVLMQEA